VAFTKEGGLEAKGSELRNVREREMEQESALQISVSRLRCRTLSTVIDTLQVLEPMYFLLLLKAACVE
jgi:hypothetical protein